MTTAQPGSAVPRHVAIIPDGNRRWARGRGAGPLEGHTAGAKAFRAVAEAALERGVECLSVWGLSLENYTKRSNAEVVGLLGIFQKQFKELTRSDFVHTQEVRINVLGRWRERFPLPVRRTIEVACEATHTYQRHNLNFFLAYSGTDEMLAAVTRLMDARGRTTGAAVTAAELKRALLTADLPPVDLLIRTGGEPHLSAGFMMWDMADAHLFFTEKLWPDFTPADLAEALAEYQARVRRFGA